MWALSVWTAKRDRASPKVPATRSEDQPAFSPIAIISEVFVFTAKGPTRTGNTSKQPSNCLYPKV